jgi:nitrile hydratase subunit beta
MFPLTACRFVADGVEKPWNLVLELSSVLAALVSGATELARGIEMSAVIPSREPLTPRIIRAEGEQPLFAQGDRVRITVRFPVGHYRVPSYLRGRTGSVEKVIEPAGIYNEEEGFGRNAGTKRHYYRVAIPLSELWPGYAAL